MTQDKETTITLECPSCSAKASLVQNIRNIPNFGEMMLTHLYCSCGFKYSDAMSLEFKQPVQYEVKINNEKDLSVKMIRSSSGTIRIPELGVEIEPGPAAEGYFTNIEGLLDRVEQAGRVIKNSAQEKEELEAARAGLDKIEAARNGKIPFTVIVLDPFGNSALVGEGVKRRELSQKEAAQLKKGIQLIGK